MRPTSVLITFPFSLGLPGGGPLDCLETARNLSRAGADVTVMTVRTDTHTAFPHPRLRERQHAATSRQQELASEGVEVIWVEPSRWHYLLDGVAFRRRVAALLEERRIDAVLGYWQEALFLPRLLRTKGILFGMVAAASYRLWLYGDESRQLPRSRLKRIVRRFVLAPFRTYVRGPLHRCKAQWIVGSSMRRSNLIFARSQRTSEEVAELFGVAHSKLHVAYCGVASDFFDVERRPAGKLTRFLYVGALVRRKGIFDSVEALGRVAAAGMRDWTLRIAGWGRQDRVLETARKCGIEDLIELLGPLDRPALLRELERAQLAIMPSHAESFGLAIGEAQAAGLAVIAYEAGAVPEVVENGVTGWLRPIGEVESLAECIREAVADPARSFAMGLAGRARIAERFSWRASAESMLAAIEARVPHD